MAISRIGQSQTTPTTGTGIGRINTGPALQKVTSTKPTEQPKQPTTVQKVAEEGKKFLARSAANFADLISESIDFTTKFVQNNPILNAPGELGLKLRGKVFGKEKEKETREYQNRWKSQQKAAAGAIKEEVDKIQQLEYLRPSEKWEKATLKEKLTTQLGETIAVLGPNIAPSFLLYVANPGLGLGVTVTSTANDVKTQAIKSGVSENKAELLGLGTGILVGSLDRLVPDELFKGPQKAKFLNGFVKRLVSITLKEAGTEVAQEDIQITAEATFRKDLGWDEIATRNAMSALGGILGGAGATTIVGTINNSFNQDILLEQPTVKEELKQETVKTPEVIEPIIKKESNVVKVSEEPKVGKKLKIVEEPKPVAEPTQPKGVGVKVKTIGQTKIENVKDMKGVKNALNEIKNEYTNLITEAEGKAIVAQEQRSGINTKDVALLKRVYKTTQKFQEGDIETIRASKHKDLVNRVVENIQESNPQMSEEEAFNYALELPTKADEMVKRPPDIKVLKEKETKLANYLELLKARQKDINEKENIEDYQEWINIVSEQEKLHKLMEVPRQQLPVGEGKIKASRLEARLKGVIGNATQEQIDTLGLTTYNQMNKADQITKASQYVVNNQQEALDVLQGKKNPPKGIIPESIYVAMTELAKDDLTLATKLSTLSATALGQRIGILSEIDKDNPVRLLNEVYKIRETEFNKRTGRTVKEAVKNEVERIKKEVKIPSKYDWAKFISEIETC